MSGATLRNFSMLTPHFYHPIAHEESEYRLPHALFRLNHTMLDSHIKRIAKELNVAIHQVTNTAKLFADGGTVPFIARYRKEQTGGLDEVAITTVRDRLSELKAIDDRKASILGSLEERSLLTDALKSSIAEAETLTALEDIYAPYRPKRRTRASIAKELGLEPLANMLLAEQATLNPLEAAQNFVSAEKGVESAEKALAGARDIIAEHVSDDAGARSAIRGLFASQGMLSSKVVRGKEEEGAKFRDYFEWSEPIAKIPSHRLLAMRRGESEEMLSIRIGVPEEDAIDLLIPMFVTAHTPAGDQVKEAVCDGYKRLLSMSIEVETRLASKKQADQEAIAVFTDNLRELLLSPALGQKNVLGIDPGFRSGCKVVCLNQQGKLLHHDVIFPSFSGSQVEAAGNTLRTLCKKYSIEAIAIGTGTASRETESFVRSLKLDTAIAIIMVNESGASIYSASDVAREEFPDHDVTVRGSVSIGRRLMDPLAELVKIDAKSIGVGQYQHDVDQTLLKKSLDDVVVSCVNHVGVELNTASAQLLTYVSGLGPQLAANIVTYRNEHGPFASRKALKEVPRLGPKAFEQAAGFLRIRDGEHPLDASAVHPERYSIVDAMAKDLHCTVSDLMRDAQLRQKIQLSNYITTDVGLPTLGDIVSELAKPGRDPRPTFEVFNFQEGVNTMEDLLPGMKLPGIVTNVTAFGAFVDIGVHQDGLVHISQLSNTFIKNPSDAVKVQQKVQVTVIDVDIPRKRISLSMKTDATIAEPRDIRTSQAERKDAPRPMKAQAKKQAPSAFGEALGRALQKQPR